MPVHLRPLHQLYHIHVVPAHHATSQTVVLHTQPQPHQLHQAHPAPAHLQPAHPPSATRVQKQVSHQLLGSVERTHAPPHHMTTVVVLSTIV